MASRRPEPHCRELCQVGRFQFRGEDVKSVRMHVALAGSAKPFRLAVPAGMVLVAAAPPVLSLTTSRDHNACLTG